MLIVVIKTTVIKQLFIFFFFFCVSFHSKINSDKRKKSETVLTVNCADHMKNTYHGCWNLTEFISIGLPLSLSHTQTHLQSIRSNTIRKLFSIQCLCIFRFSFVSSFRFLSFFKLLFVSFVICALLWVQMKMLNEDKVTENYIRSTF